MIYIAVQRTNIWFKIKRLGIEWFCCVFQGWGGLGEDILSSPYNPISPTTLNPQLLLLLLLLMLLGNGHPRPLFKRGVRQKMQHREIKDVSNVRIKQIDISYNIFHYNWISFLLTLDFCEISERIFSGTTPCISRPHIGDSFCFNNPLLYRKPVCVRIAIASGEKMEKRKIWQFWNWESCSRAAVQQQQQSYSSSSSSSNRRRRRADCEMQAPPTLAFHDNTSGEEEGLSRCSQSGRQLFNFFPSASIFHSLT